MRIKLNLKPGIKRVMPINYQYELSAWLYKVIHLSDPDFAHWLHNQGYSYEKKRFRHFTFTNIKIPQRQIKEDRINITGDNAELQVSFSVEKTVQHFITGIFQDQTFSIGDKQSQADFTVTSVEALPEPDLGSEAVFHTFSPLCVSANRNSQAVYLHPHDSEYQRILTENLRAKAGSLSEKEDNGGYANTTQDIFNFEVLSEPRSRLVKIKSGTPEQTFVRGYLFDFKLKGPADLLRLGYQTGFGEKNSMGFGCVGVRR